MNLLFTPILHFSLFPRSVGLIDSACATVNNKLHRLSALLPDAASLSPLEYDTSRRADPEVLERLISQARKLRVSSLHTILTHPVAYIERCKVFQINKSIQLPPSEAQCCI